MISSISQWRGHIITERRMQGVSTAEMGAVVERVFIIRGRGYFRLEMNAA